MKISLIKVVPAPLSEKDIRKSEIWEKDIILQTPENYMIYADSGKGKTTFINIIFGIRKDYSGEVFIDNKNIKSFSNYEISKIRKERISVVPQGLMLFNELTALENIQIKNKILNFKSEKEILEMFEILDIQDFINKKTSTLSYGQQQRLAIIRALCQKFEFILLDEIFSHIDKQNSLKAWNLIISEAEQQNAGIIITSLENNINIDINKFKV